MRAAGPGGEANPVILAACALCRVDEVYRMGGAQAIAALAYGTESVKRGRRDRRPRATPGCRRRSARWSAQVGIDGIAGPSELVVVASAGADPELVALDLRAQAEHGPESMLAVIATDQELLDAVVERAGDVEASPLAQDARAALQAAEEMAPEHLELVGAEAEALAGEVRRAGCVFVGRDGATAFGDYIAGSNHILPTGGAARFQSALSAVHVPAQDGSRIVRRGRGSAPGPARRGARARGGLPRPRRVHGAPRVTRSADI